ncbi:Hypothetical protein PMM2036 [Prochlorococcus marinus subsp. pastoris str. CCMP1986]|uniref:Uncharacterized protein n=1 Tax=Prochlorococcus marinus subsp. pastoris (strain CCMP1986 / NIES-2087 / MED4) TaxID=59919 RepID=B9ER41_PROMP|nr:Hypothetical protein PMM2036 [Prochlorococcus marinus subsp. pastoris str. CCMP1986]
MVFSSWLLQYTNDLPLKYMFTMMQLLNLLKSPSFGLSRTAVYLVVDRTIW